MRRVVYLSVPTGGGKTLVSLRFAIEHAKTHQMERISYIIPYTSIIEQNAREVREILGDDWVLEQHSNLEPEVQTWQSKILLRTGMRSSFSHMVQFLETCLAAARAAFGVCINWPTASLFLMKFKPYRFNAPICFATL